MDKINHETALDGYPIAPVDAQRYFEPKWEEQYARHFNTVRIIADDVYAVGDEDLDFGKNLPLKRRYGPGIYVFRRTDTGFEEVAQIDISRPGWSLRLKLLCRR